VTTPSPKKSTVIPTKEIPPLLSPTPQLCSPLEGISSKQLSDLIHNPYNPPPAGKDDAHQGVDFAVVQNNIALPGNNVQAILAGRIAAVIKDRFPYGNAVLIETPLNNLPENWLTQFTIPTIAPTLAPLPALNCPQSLPVLDNKHSRSIYILYAHFQETPGLRIDDNISCGEVIGKVGMSGNAINPHLHVETRIGPSGVTFTSICHYDTSATAEEMQNYCLWRVTNIFQLIDPMSIIQIIQ
jgi:murein DD-endopeptidase MepM/ murein hydrolase activator NlpD